MDPAVPYDRTVPYPGETQTPAATSEREENVLEAMEVLDEAGYEDFKVKLRTLVLCAKQQLAIVEQLVNDTYAVAWSVALRDAVDTFEALLREDS